MFELNPEERSRLTSFLSKLVRTPSLSGQEGRLAQLLADELRRLGVEDSGGMVRAGGVHYNNPDDIDRFAKALHKIARG